MTNESSDPEAPATDPPANGQGPNSTPRGLSSIAATGTLLITALGALAVTTGVLERIERNHGVQLAFGLGMALLAGALWVFGSFFKARLQRTLQIVAIIALVSGFSFGILALVRTQNDKRLPTITALVKPDNS